MGPAGEAGSGQEACERWALGSVSTTSTKEDAPRSPLLLSPPAASRKSQSRFPGPAQPGRPVPPTGSPPRPRPPALPLALSGFPPVCLCLCLSVPAVSPCLCSCFSVSISGPASPRSDGVPSLSAPGSLPAQPLLSPGPSQRPATAPGSISQKWNSHVFLRLLFTPSALVTVPSTAYRLGQPRGRCWVLQGSALLCP